MCALHSDPEAETLPRRRFRVWIESPRSEGEWDTPVRSVYRVTSSSTSAAVYEALDRYRDRHGDWPCEVAHVEELFGIYEDDARESGQSAA